MDDLFAPSDVSWTPVSPKLATLRRLNAAIVAGLAAIAALLALGAIPFVAVAALLQKRAGRRIAA